MSSSSLAVPGSTPAKVTVSTKSILHTVLQFLQERGLRDTCAALSRESGAFLNASSDLGGLRDAVSRGHWQRVLSETSGCRLSSALQTALYEQIALELREVGETSAAVRGLFFVGVAAGKKY